METKEILDKHSASLSYAKATSSNCGKLLKLQQPSLGRKTLDGRVNSPGYGKIVEDATMDNPQPSSKSFWI